MCSSIGLHRGQLCKQPPLLFLGESVSSLGKPWESFVASGAEKVSRLKEQPNYLPPTPWYFVNSSRSPAFKAFHSMSSSYSVEHSLSIVNNRHCLQWSRRPPKFQCSSPTPGMLTCYYSLVTDKETGLRQIPVVCQAPHEGELWNSLWRVAITYCSCRGPKLGSQCPHKEVHSYLKFQL